MQGLKFIEKAVEIIAGFAFVLGVVLLVLDYDGMRGPVVYFAAVISGVIAIPATLRWVSKSAIRQFFLLVGVVIFILAVFGPHLT